MRYGTFFAPLTATYTNTTGAATAIAAVLMQCQLLSSLSAVRDEGRAWLATAEQKYRRFVAAWRYRLLCAHDLPHSLPVVCCTRPSASMLLASVLAKVPLGSFTL